MDLGDAISKFGDICMEAGRPSTANWLLCIETKPDLVKVLICILVTGFICNLNNMYIRAQSLFELREGQHQQIHCSLYSKSSFILTPISRITKRLEGVPIAFWVDPVLAIPRGISDRCNELAGLGGLCKVSSE